MGRSRSFAIFVAALLAAAGLGTLLRGPGGHRLSSGAGLNVLLVTLDTTRADRLGCYGHRRARTPRLDRLAAEGVRFENAIADVPVTLPSHASIFTGLYPFEHGVRNNGNFRLADGFETIATLLRQKSYRTAAFVSSFILDRRYGLGRGFETYDDRMGEAPTPGSGLEAERRGDRTALALASWLEGYAKQARPAPFFVWLHLYDPHEPYQPPPPFRDLFRDDPYDGEIAFADSVLGSTLDNLAQLGLHNRLLVAVVADHGESLGEHGEETHSIFIYESAIRVPMILWRPGLLPAGRLVSEPVRTIDLAPTILDILGAPPLAARHARSLRSLIDGRSPEGPPAAYAESYVPKLYLGGAPLRALRDERFKLIDAPRPELYDLVRDPGETHNRYDDDPGTARLLTRELERLTAGSPGAMNVTPVDREATEKLRALGYLGAGVEMLTNAPGQTGRDPKDLIGTFNRLRRASGLVRERRFPEALAIARPVVAEDPENAFAHVLLGNTYMGLQQYAAALEHFRVYLALVPDSAQAHQWIAVCFENMGDRTRALREAGLALALDPRLSDARILRAGVLANLGRRAEAVKELRAGIEADPQQPLIRLDLAELLSDAGQSAEAEAEYRAILKRDAAYAPALASLGALLLRRGELDEASGALRRALEVDPRQDEVRFNLASTLERQSRFEEARAEYRRLAEGPETPPAVRAAARKRLERPER
jgi:arylsulfatase A-like enzyme/Flp pilus assembly protein TadD